MNILQIIPELGFGGAETMCVNLSIDLKKLGHNVYVASLYSKKTPLCTRLENEGIEIFYLDKKRGLDISLFQKIRKLIIVKKIEVVHSHLYAFKYAHFFLNLSIKHIHTVHNIAEKEASKRDQIINGILYRLGKVTPIALSNEVKNSIINVYHLRKEMVPVIYNGVPLNKCIKKESYNLAKKVIHIGRFAPAKNQKMIIEAIYNIRQHFTNVELYLYGEGSQYEEAYQLASQLDCLEYIHFCGIVEESYQVLNSADIFVLPSLWEGMPMTIIEAMGTGLPIIASKVGGIPDMLVNNESAILIDPDKTSFINALKRLIENGDLRKKIGKRALKDSVLFSSKSMAREYEIIYKDNR